MTPPFYPVDQMLSLAIAALMGLQHALAMIGDAYLCISMSHRRLSCNLQVAKQVLSA